MEKVLDRYSRLDNTNLKQKYNKYFFTYQNGAMSIGFDTYLEACAYRDLMCQNTNFIPHMRFGSDYVD